MYRKLVWMVLMAGSLTTTAQTNNRSVVNQPVMPGPNGVLVFALEKPGTKRTPNSATQYIVSREDKTGGGFKKIATLSFPASAAALEKRLEPGLLQGILQQRKLRSVTDLMAQLQAGKVDTLGLYLSSTAVLQALGLLYIDKEITQPNNTIGYRMEVMRNGGTSLLYTQYLRDVRYTSFPGFKMYNRVANDSSVMATWYAVGGRAPFAQIYSSIDAGPMNNTATLMVYNRKDTLFTTYSALTKPGQRVSVYIRPADMAGNLGPASDTINLLALTLNNTFGVDQLSAADTLNGILLRWKPLPAAAYFTGIRVLKSRSGTDDYILADTLPATASAWLDRQIIPGTQYYYIVEPIVYNLPQHLAVTPTRIMMHTKGRAQKLLAPQNVNISYTTDRNIRLSWMPNSELNLFAYYVLRGTSRAKMQVISPAIRDTVFIDSLQHLHGGHTYLYAISCMDMEMNRSDTSAIVSIMPAKAKPVTAPAGLAARYTEQGVRLLWNNVARTESSVTGYIVYKRKKGDKYFAPLLNTLIPANYYLDTAISSPGVYEYGCVAVDAFGNQSILSSTAAITITGGNWLYPPADFNLRNLSAGIEISIPASLNASNQYVIYRRLAGNKWQKISEGAGLFVDKQVSKAQLYVYAVATRSAAIESARSAEKSIRRK